MKAVFSGFCGLELDLDSIENVKENQILVKVSVGTFQNKIFQLLDFWEIKQANNNNKKIQPPSIFSKIFFNKFDIMLLGIFFLQNETWSISHLNFSGNSYLWDDENHCYTCGYLISDLQRNEGWHLTGSALHSET